MATIWLSKAGNDVNSGTNYANAVSTLGQAFDLVGEGDTLNVVNDGTHLACDFSGRLSFTAWTGTNYTSDPGLIIQGVDSGGNPAIAKIAAEHSSGKFYFVTTGANASYLLVQGIHFDWTDAEANSASEFYRIIGYSTAPQQMWIRGCVFEVLPSETTWTDTGWYAPINFTNSGVYSAGREVRISHNLFLNSGMRFGTNDGYTYNIHNNVFYYDANGVPSGTSYAISGGVFSYTNLEQIAHHNTIIRRYTATGDTSTNQLACNGPRQDNQQIHSNIYYSEINNVTSSDQVGSVLQVGYSSMSATSGPGVYDYNLWAWVNGYNSTNLFDGSSAGYGSYQFNEAWRGTGTPTTPTQTLATNDTQTFTDSLTGVFNAAGTWTWAATAGYEIELPHDLRPIVGRSAGLGGTVPGAIDEAVNATPVAGNVTYTATSGIQKTVSATNGVLSNATDADLDTLTASVITNPSHGVLDTFNTTTGAFEYTPNLTYTGTDIFTFQVSDGTTWSNSASAIINVSNQTPTGQNQSYSVQENQMLSVPAASGLLNGASDPDSGQTVSVTGVGTPTDGTLNSYNTTTGSFVYTPDFGFSGTDSFSFQITDGNTNSATYTASIQVLATSAPSVTNVIDTAPFFKPTLEVTTEFRVKTKKNRRKHHDLANYTESMLWDESTHRIITLATNTSTRVNLGGVAEAEYLIVETDNDINVSINGNSNYWPVSSVVAVALTAATTVYLQNESTTNEAQVILAVSD
jgi:hypothetical protein